MSTKVRDIVIGKIIDALSEGKIPWAKPWGEVAARNIVSDKPYRGINAILLNIVSDRGAFYCTKKQATEAGLSIAGVKSELVTFYGKAKARKDKQTGEEKSGFMFLKYYLVFPVAELTGTLPAKWQETIDRHNVARDGAKPVTGEAKAQEIVSATGADIREAGHAFYNWSEDFIGIPARDSFTTALHYFATTFHEVAHWTGAEKRLDRDIKNCFGGKGYAREELCAEIGAAMLMAESGLDFAATLENTRAYCQGWAKKLDSDRAVVMSAASKAHEAVDYIMGLGE